MEAETFDGYEVYDRDDDKIGKADDLFLGETNQPEYIGVQMGLFGLSGTTLVPWEICRADEATGRIEVEAEKERVKDAPNFDDDQQITPEFERQVHEYYGLESREGVDERGPTARITPRKRNIPCARKRLTSPRAISKTRTS